MLSTLERASHLIGTYLEQTTSGFGITQAEAHVLAQVARAGPTPIATLHKEFGHKRSTLTNVLDRLEQRQLVRRGPNPGDRRSLLVHLTAPGRRMARHVTGVLDGLEHDVLTSVTERDVQGVDSVVAALAAIVEQQSRIDGHGR
jgi:MarR family transcriptional regulator, organic hydroperoxide resistance regulator